MYKRKKEGRKEGRKEKKEIEERENQNLRKKDFVQ